MDFTIDTTTDILSNAVGTALVVRFFILLAWICQAIQEPVSRRKNNHNYGRRVNFPNGKSYE